MKILPEKSVVDCIVLVVTCEGGSTRKKKKWGRRVIWDLEDFRANFELFEI